MASSGINCVAKTRHPGKAANPESGCQNRFFPRETNNLGQTRQREGALAHPVLFTGQYKPQMSLRHAFTPLNPYQSNAKFKQRLNLLAEIFHKDHDVVLRRATLVVGRFRNF